jgi:hypothetical protein
VSPDTKEWVVANATLIPRADNQKRAFVHFEVTVESFRRALGEQGKNYELRVIDGQTGRVVIDSTRPQQIGTALGVSRDARFTKLARTAQSTGTTEVQGHQIAYRHIESTKGNANDWIVVARANTPTGSFFSGLGLVPVAMLGVALMIIVLAGLSLRAARRVLEAHASTDVPDRARQPPQTAYRS